MRRTLCYAAAVAALASANVEAASMEAYDNATIQPGGPRSGSSGKAFFNIEGDANGSFASYGVARFDAMALRGALDASFGAGAWLIDNISLQLTQSNASFTADGPVAIHFTGDDTTSIQSGVSPFAHPFGGDFPDALLVTSYNFTEISTGTAESHALWMRGAANSAGADALKADLLSDGIVTLALVDGASGVAATYAGYTNFTYAGPTLIVDVSPVPEPEIYAMMLAGLGLIGLAARDRRTARAQKRDGA